MANYNYNENELVLLNDKLVANSLSDSTTTKYGVPTIPSQKLFKESYDKLSSDDKNISDFIEDVISADLYKLSGQYEGTKTDVEISCNAISSLIGSISADLSNAITSDVKHLDDLQISAEQISSKINSLCTQISNDLTAKYSWLSGEANRLCTELSDNIESKFVHKAGDSVKWLSVGSSLSTTLFRANTSGKAIPTDQFTDVVVDENGFKVDAIGEGRQIVLSTNNSTNDIIVNGSSLSDHIKNEVRISADEAIILAKAYTDTEIQKLDVDDTAVAKQFVTAVSETDGKIHVQRAALVPTDIPTISESQVRDLTEDLHNLSINYVKVSDFKTTLIDNDGKFLSGGDFKFEYNDQTHVIWLSAGENPLSIDTTDFIKNRIVHHTSIIEYDGKKWLRLYWTEDEKQFVDISITDLVQVYKFNDGLLTSYVDNKWQVDIDDTIARTTYADAISSHADTISTSLQAEVERATVAEAANTTAINTEIARAEGVEGSLQTQINSVSTDLTAEVEARENADDKITTDVNAVSSDVISLKTYATALSGSSPDNIGIIATLSNNIMTLQSDIIKELKFVNHIVIGNDDTPILTIEKFFELQKLAVKDGNKVANGSIYDIQFVDGSDYSASSTYQVEDLSLGLGDYLIVHDHNNDAFVSIADLHATGENKNLYVLKAGTSRYEFENVYAWLSGETGRLCAEISNDIVAKYSKLTSDDNFISGEVDRLCSEISNDLTAKYSWLSGETDRLCIAISTAVDLSASALCTELCACELSVDSISTAIALSTVALCTELCACELSVDGISTAVALSAVALCTEISNLSDEVSAISNDLSSAISSKIWIKDLNDDGSTLTAGNMDTLSVIKITKDDFDTQVATGTLTMSSNTLYIVSSDYIDAYGQQLCNLTMTEDMVASEAANKHYVDAKDGKLATDINAVSSSVEVIKSKFNADTIATDPVLAKLLEDKNDSDISTVISAVMYIFNTLTQV